jgi:hypothetical protein
MLDRSQHNLSERFQISENIKTTQSLLPLVGFYCLSSIICFSITVYTLLHIEGKQATAIEMQKLWIPNQIFSSSIAVYASVYPFLCANGHKYLNEKLKQMFFCCQGKKVVPTTADVCGVNGEQLIPAQVDEQQVHFIALEAAWEAIY